MCFWGKARVSTAWKRLHFYEEAQKSDVFRIQFLDATFPQHLCPRWISYIDSMVSCRLVPAWIRWGRNQALSHPAVGSRDETGSDSFKHSAARIHPVHPQGLDLHRSLKQTSQKGKVWKLQSSHLHPSPILYQQGWSLPPIPTFQTSGPRGFKVSWHFRPGQWQ